MFEVIIFFLLSTTGIDSTQSNACTIIALRTEDAMFVANNEDANNIKGKMWVVPSTKGQYGRVCFGFDENWKIAESGLNEHGLFIGVNTVDKAGWEKNPALPEWEEWEGWFETGVPDGILAKCATVDEATEIFWAYNLFVLDKVKYLLADRSGNSAVVEWSNDGLEVVKRIGAFQISTNFVASNYKREDYPSYRYNIAERLLINNDRPAVDILRAVLSATHMEIYSPTVYSVIYNLESGELYVYYFHNFEEVKQLNIKDLLCRGEFRIMVVDLVGIKPFAANYYGEKKPADIYR